MPNYCNATIVLKGRKECVQKFIDYLKADYCYKSYDYGKLKRDRGFTEDRHFYRIFEVYENEPDDNGMMRTQSVDIQCAWSVYSCMFDGPFSYYYDCTKVPDMNPVKPQKPNAFAHPRKYSRTQLDEMRREAADHILHSTEILTEAERLGLQIEIKSQEPGMGFSEHYRINNGILLQNEENPFEEHWCDLDTKAEYEEEWGVEFPGTEEEYKKYHDEETIYVPNEDIVYINDNDWIFQNEPKIAKKVMCKVVDNSKPYQDMETRSRDFSVIARREERERAEREWEERRNAYNKANNSQD